VAQEMSFDQILSDLKREEMYVTQVQFYPEKFYIWCRKEEFVFFLLQCFPLPKNDEAHTFFTKNGGTIGLRGPFIASAQDFNSAIAERMGFMVAPVIECATLYRVINTKGKTFNEVKNLETHLRSLLNMARRKWYTEYNFDGAEGTPEEMKVRLDQAEVMFSQGYLEKCMQLLTTIGYPEAVLSNRLKDRILHLLGLQASVWTICIDAEGESFEAIYPEKISKLNEAIKSYDAGSFEHCEQLLATLEYPSDIPNI
jgi:hypothetical protein